jgi:hypothetical protein
MASTTDIDHVTARLEQRQLLREPLQVSGILSEKHRNFPLTPAIGQEFPEASIQDLLTAPNSDALLRDLAITGTDALCMHTCLLAPLHCVDDKECTNLYE